MTLFQKTIVALTVFDALWRSVGNMGLDGSLLGGNASFAIGSPVDRHTVAAKYTAIAVTIMMMSLLMIRECVAPYECLILIVLVVRTTARVVLCEEEK